MKTLSRKPHKVTKLFRLKPKLAAKLPKVAAREGRTQTAVLERALAMYFVTES